MRRARPGADRRGVLRRLLLALAVAVCAAPTAQAARTGVIAPPGDASLYHARIAVYQAGPGEVNGVAVAHFVHARHSWVSFTEKKLGIHITIGRGCQTGDPRRGDTGRVRGTVASPNPVYCRLPGPRRAASKDWSGLFLGDRDDAGGLTPRAIGGAVLSGGSGHDLLIGGGGDDTICTGQLARHGAGGLDVDDCTGFSTPIVPRHLAHDLAMGGGGDDLLLGTSAEDGLEGGEGSDVARGGAGPDVVLGGPGNDFLVGGNGNDNVDDNYSLLDPEATLGDDEIDGGDGLDMTGYRASPAPATITATGGSTAGGTDRYASIERLTGSAFDDAITGGPGVDDVFAGAGDDRVDVSGDRRPVRADADTGDVVDCGDGTDAIVADRDDGPMMLAGDGYSHCETATLVPIEVT